MNDLCGEGEEDNHHSNKLDSKPFVWIWTPLVGRPCECLNTLFGETRSRLWDEGVPGEEAGSTMWCSRSVSHPLLQTWAALCLVQR